MIKLELLKMPHLISAGGERATKKEKNHIELQSIKIEGEKKPQQDG